jgi:branched-chain amino acid transport system substrate-binding protein
MQLAQVARIALGIGALALLPQVALAQANEQFVPQLVYRTGAYGPTGVPFANGRGDYFALVNERGGINGVKIVAEECEFGYDTARGVECYERLKSKGVTGAASVTPLSTGVTFALTEKTLSDKIPLLTMGYGRADSADGRVFAWNFPMLGTYWSAADILIQHLGTKNGGADKLKGKKITLVFHDSPYGREPIALLEAHAKRYGFIFSGIPITAPGIEQKAAWLQIRQTRPDYVLLWGWGVMNSTAIKEAVAVGYPRDKMYGVWWSGAEQDVTPAGADAKGYNALALNPAGSTFAVHRDLFAQLYDRGKGNKREDVGQVLYNRGLIDGLLTVEAIRTAMGRYGNKPMTGEQVRWGFENLNLSEARIKELGFDGLVSPIKMSCQDHEGARRARIHQWDGAKWVYTTEWIEANAAVLRPMYEESARKYAAEKNIQLRDCSKEG